MESLSFPLFYAYFTSLAVIASTVPCVSSFPFVHLPFSLKISLFLCAPRLSLVGALCPFFPPRSGKIPQVS